MKAENNDGISEIERRLLNFDEDGVLNRQDCVDIFTYWGLGKRVVKALPRFAFSVPREISVQEAPPDAVKRFEKVSRKLKQDLIIKRTTVYARMFGMAGTALVHEKEDITKNLTYAELLAGESAFIALDPLNLSGTFINQDASSFRFMRPDSIQVYNKVAGSRRATIIQNGDPVYLKFNTSTFTFGGVSVFQNMIPLIQSWVRGTISLRRMATKASSIVFKGKDDARANSITADAASASLKKLRDMENDGATMIGKDASVEFFNMTGVSEVDAILKSIEREIMMALDDTPTALLLDKSLSNGLSEGSEDMKAVIMAVNNFREEMAAPLYAFTDPYIMKLAWTDEYIEKVKLADPKKYGDMPCESIRALWESSFDYEWGNLYPEPEKDIQATNLVKMQVMQLAQQMGASTEDLKGEIKEQGIFKNDIDFTEPPEPVQPDPFGNKPPNPFGAE